MTKEKIFEWLQNKIYHIDENFNSSEVESQLTDQLTDNLFPYSFSVEAGISKAVILIKGAPFVIKMPFFKIFDEDWYSDCYRDWSKDLQQAIDEYAKAKVEQTKDPESEILSKEELALVRSLFIKDNPEPDETDHFFLYNITGASNFRLDNGDDPAIPDWDYCRLESVIYQLALEEGLGAYFAEEGYLGTIDKTPVYYQTRCIPMSEMEIDYNSKEIKQKRTKSKNICEALDINCFNPIWIADFIDLYGEEELQRLNKFLQHYEIGDLRDCNIGYLDGAPILFDYTDFRDW